jgi:hypothetical protein
MADAFWSLKTKPKSYWTAERLRELEAAALRWRELIQQINATIDIDQEDLL